MKKKLMILAGGYSKERDISMITGKEVYKALKKKYTTILVDPKGDIVNKLRNFKPDIVFNALHGRFGEDGYIQSIFENEKICYTHSGVESSSLSIDKEICLDFSNNDLSFDFDISFFSFSKFSFF